MPIPVLCPACGAKIIAPDSSLGKRMKCPECGDRLTVVSVNDTNRAGARPVVRGDDPVDTSPLDPGWKRVALGYRLYGFALLFLLLGVLVVTAASVIPRVTGVNGETVLKDAVHHLAVGSLIVFFSFAVSVCMALGNLFFMGMPADASGGKGKSLAVVMFVLGFVPGLNALPWILLPIYSAGVGKALDRSRLTRRGWGLVTWYVNAALMVPGLAAVFFFSAARYGSPIVAVICGAVVAVVGEGVAFFSIWKTLGAMRRGIEEAVGERGLRVPTRG